MPGRIPSVAVSESCTGGLVMAQIVATPGSGDWFRGGVVAYDREVKFDVLGVERGPVVTSAAAAQMATAVRRLVGADLGLATTGEIPAPGRRVELGREIEAEVLDADPRGIKLLRLRRKEQPEPEDE